MDKIIRIELQVMGQELLIPQVIPTVTGREGLIECIFKFDSAWDNYINIQAKFKNGTIVETIDIFKQSYNSSIHSCMVPPSVLERPGLVYIALQGKNIDSEVEKTVLKPIIRAIPTASKGRNELNPSPDQYTQFVAYMTEQIQKVLDLKVKAVPLLSSEDAYVERTNFPDGSVLLTFGLPRGFTGPKGDKGDPGNDGVDGRSFTVLGRYETLEELKRVHPTGNPGDAYLIGDETTTDAYLWDVDKEEWIFAASVKGVSGDINFTEFAVDVNTGRLTAYYTQYLPDFRISKTGHLEVTIE